MTDKTLKDLNMLCSAQAYHLGFTYGAIQSVLSLLRDKQVLAAYKSLEQLSQHLESAINKLHNRDEE